MKFNRIYRVSKKKLNFNSDVRPGRPTPSTMADVARISEDIRRANGMGVSDLLLHNDGRRVELPRRPTMEML